MSCVSKVVSQLVLHHGREIAEQPERVEAMLRDLCPDSRKEITVLVATARLGVAKALANNSAFKNVRFKSISEELHGKLAYDKQLVKWALSTWTLALNPSVNDETRSARYPTKQHPRTEKPPRDESYKIYQFENRENNRIDLKSPKDNLLGVYVGQTLGTLPDGKGEFRNSRGKIEFVGEWEKGKIVRGVEYADYPSYLLVFEGEFTNQGNRRGHGLGRRFFYNPYRHDFDPNKISIEDVGYICEADFSNCPVVGKIYVVIGHFSLGKCDYRKNLEHEGKIGVLTGQCKKQKQDEYILGHVSYDSSIGYPFIYGFGKEYRRHPDDIFNTPPKVIYEGEFVKPPEPWYGFNGGRCGQGMLYDYVTGMKIAVGDYKPNDHFWFKGKEFCVRTERCIFEGVSHGMSRDGKFYDADSGKLFYDGQVTVHYGISDPFLIKGHHSVWSGKPESITKNGMGVDYNLRNGSVKYRGEYLRGMRMYRGPIKWILSLLR